jgi:hypothetical protein
MYCHLCAPPLPLSKIIFAVHHWMDTNALFVFSSVSHKTMCIQSLAWSLIPSNVYEVFIYHMKLVLSVSSYGDTVQRSTVGGVSGLELFLYIRRYIKNCRSL